MGFGGFWAEAWNSISKSALLAWSPFATTKVCMAMNYWFAVSSGLSQTRAVLLGKLMGREVAVREFNEVTKKYKTLEGDSLWKKKMALRSSPELTQADLAVSPD